jgi:hypothetical protein
MRLVSLSFLVFVIFASNGHWLREVVATRLDDRVVISPRTVSLIRRGALLKDFPQKKTAKVTYPVVSGLKNIRILRRVQRLLQVKNVFDYSLDEYREGFWLEEFYYKVNYNQNYILDLTFTEIGTGAYPDTHMKHFVISLKDGNVIKASDVFVSEKLATLSALVNRKLQEELKNILNTLASKSDPEDLRVAREAREPQEFKIENLDDFSVGTKGITFLYDAGYPHVIQAFEPKGQYFFSYAELKPFIKPNSLLGQFVN